MPPERSINVMSFDPLFATTAMPVAGLIATSLGAVPTVIGLAAGGVYDGCTATLATANFVASVLLLMDTGYKPGTVKSPEFDPPPMDTDNCRVLPMVWLAGSCMPRS